MFESRCGVCCNSCQKKEKVNCKGCPEMKEPFWGGVCQVKTCCEQKNLNHCGECSKFPCTMVSEMGKQFGYDPEPRLERCRIWKKEEGI